MRGSLAPWPSLPRSFDISTGTAIAVGLTEHRRLPGVLSGAGDDTSANEGASEPSAEAGPSKTPRAQHPLALVGKLLQQLKKDTLQNICEDLKEPVSGNKEELIMRIADAM